MSEQIDTGELREQLRSGLWRTWAKVQAIAIGDELDALRAKVATLKELQRREARDWAEAHDLLLAATGTVVDEGNVTGQPTLIELVEGLVKERDNQLWEIVKLQEECDRLVRDALQAKLIAELASHDYGWDGVNNSKVLSTFVADEWAKLTAERDALRELLQRIATEYPSAVGANDCPPSPHACPKCEIYHLLDEAKGTGDASST